MFVDYNIYITTDIMVYKIIITLLVWQYYLTLQTHKKEARTRLRLRRQENQKYFFKCQGISIFCKSLLDYFVSYANANIHIDLNSIKLKSSL